MVFMGLFSRLVLGFPLLFPNSFPSFQACPDTHRFPDSGSRTSLRFLPAPRYIQKRRHKYKVGKILEDEISLFQPTYEDFTFDFVGEIIENGRNDFDFFSPLSQKLS